MRVLFAFLTLAVLLSSGLLARRGPGPAGAAFLGANGKIAFTTARDGNQEIYLMNPDGSNETNLTNHPADDFRPAWTADGARIAFDSGRDDPLLELYVMDAGGANTTRLTSNPAEDWEAAWSPDRSKIAFGTTRDGNFEVYTIDADGSNPTRLTFDPGIDRHAVWSPDGSQIAFRSARDGNGEVYVMNADGSNQTRLTFDPGFDSRPAWSPDGSKIAFNSSRGGNTDIYVMNPDGSNQIRLTTHPAPDDSAAWSPDGSRIIFVSLRDGNSEIYSMNPDGSDQTNLTNNLAEDTWPDWQPFIDGDGDGCADYQEQGASRQYGGQRNPALFWDFFDTPTPPDFARDRAVTIADISAVIARFGAVRLPAPSKDDALAEALAPPPPAPAYHPAFDRTATGTNFWGSGSPNGSITIQDIERVIQQFGHSCA